MKILQFLILFAITIEAQAVVSCSPDVPKKTCETVNAIFTVHDVKIDVVVADPTSFLRSKELFARKMEVQIRIGDFRNPIIHNSYSENLLFVREGQSCPTRVVISTDQFLPLEIAKGSTGEKVIVGASGFDPVTILSLANYVHGFIEGCAMGLVTYISDETVNKPKQQ